MALVISDAETFTQDYVEETVSRLSKLREDTAPRWDGIKASELVPHLICAVKYSMGRRGDMPHSGTWFTRNVVGPLVLRGLWPVADAQNPDRFGPDDFPAERGDLESLHALLEEYLMQVQTGALETKPHPLFGQLGIDGWARFHIIHFEHHLRQFGL